MKSKQSDHPSNTPFEGKQKKKQTKYRTGYKRNIEPKSKAPTSPEVNESLPPPVAVTYNHDTEELRIKGYAVPNKKCEQHIHIDTLWGNEVAREEIYDWFPSSDDISFL